MLSILIDSNILLDVMATRQPFFETSSKVIETLKDKDITGYVSASSITDIYYIARRELKDKELVIQLIKDILKFIKIATVSEELTRLLNWNGAILKTLFNIQPRF